MTERLYYNNSFLYDFVAGVIDRRTLADGRIALVLDRTAFYPTSGGQVFDTGWMEVEGGGSKVQVVEVEEDEASGEVLHIVRPMSGDNVEIDKASRVRGFIDGERRRDHMQQHSGQHVLSAAFVELMQAPTVSFHMGEESCTIDVDCKALSAKQVAQAELRANQVIWEDRAVAMHSVTVDEAKAMGVRKIPPAERDKLRLIDIKDFDLCACGGTHVKSTGQIGAILVRKIEKVKQGFRVEFVCGERAVKTARKDFESLSEAGGLYSTHLWEVPAQIRRSVEDGKAAGKTQHRLNEEIAALLAEKRYSTIEEHNGERLVAEVLTERDVAFAKLFAQKLTSVAKNCVALIGVGGAQPTLIFAQSPGLAHDMGGIMKETMALLGGRGGGNKDMAQGGVADAARLQEAIEFAKSKLK